ncbi:MAG: MOSC domain-containing protein [Bacillati bacterium ANGP1]|uniref:MOSC domain-containing protein n=1 Tax=Candidatus Segetimicrobium genomatis TaxID=2569760 RepID=A0A537JGR0_9BACT|nr:MAG: MOSC domain-containing protein [Terrabacteria group bacterium ANGP1]
MSRPPAERSGSRQGASGEQAWGRQGIVRSINVSRGGVPKRPVAAASIHRAGLQGDGHDDPRHGGPEAAVSLFSLEVITRIAAEGHPIGPGTTGENLTVEGLDWSLVVPGTRLRVGEVVLEITRFTAPCRTIRGSFLDRDPSRVHQEQHPGESRVYARVLAEGAVTAGEAIEIVDGGGARHGNLTSMGGDHA